MRRQGAKAVKIWKNVGMSEKDAGGKLIMLDDPAISPVADKIQKLGLTLIGHQGEPHNCWLPLEQMTTDNDREYFKQSPAATTCTCIPRCRATRTRSRRATTSSRRIRSCDSWARTWQPGVRRRSHRRVPRSFPECQRRHGGAHEPGAVPVGARLREGPQLLHQVPGPAAVRHGSDAESRRQIHGLEFKRSAHDVWTRDWRYLATDETQRVEIIKADVPGLALPREVIDKVYYRQRGARLRALSATRRAARRRRAAGPPARFPRARPCR